jgi:RCC1 and BTB domain-containing protein
MHTCCITSDGYAHSFGLNKNGQLGTGDYIDQNEPRKIQAIANYFVIYAKCGGNTTFLVTEERNIFSFGCNMYGRLAQKETH